MYIRNSDSRLVPTLRHIAELHANRPIGKLQFGGEVNERVNGVMIETHCQIQDFARSCSFPFMDYRISFSGLHFD